MVVLELRPAHDSAASRRVQLELENEEEVSVLSASTARSNISLQTGPTYTSRNSRNLSYVLVYARNSLPTPTRLTQKEI